MTSIDQRCKTSRFIKLSTVLLLIPGLVMADEFSSGQNTQNNKKRPFRQYLTQTPECAGLIRQFWQLTDDIEAKGEQWRTTTNPEREQLRQEQDKLIKQRGKVHQQIMNCIRNAAQNQNRSTTRPNETIDAALAERNLPPFPPENWRLPDGAVASGDPDAPDSSIPGFLGSFKGTKNRLGYCYTYACGSTDSLFNKLPVIGIPVDNPNAIGHNRVIPGDVLTVFSRVNNPFNGTYSYSPTHYAVYKGKGIFYQKNGASSIEIVNSKFFLNPAYSNAVFRYINPKTGK